MVVGDFVADNPGKPENGVNLSLSTPLQWLRASPPWKASALEMDIGGHKHKKFIKTMNNDLLTWKGIIAFHDFTISGSVGMDKDKWVAAWGQWTWPDDIDIGWDWTERSLSQQQTCSVLQKGIFFKVGKRLANVIRMTYLNIKEWMVFLKSLLDDKKT